MNEIENAQYREECAAFNEAGKIVTALLEFLTVNERIVLLRSIHIYTSMNKPKQGDVQKLREISKRLLLVLEYKDQGLRSAESLKK